MKSQYPKINIVVLNYNGKSCLKSCLASLFCVDYPNFEVVVVDNNSGDGSLESARLDFPKATFIKNEQNLGFSAGNNVGIKYSLERTADFVLLLNNDTEVRRDFLKQLVVSALENEKAGLFSPQIFSENNKDIWFSGGKIDWLRMKSFHGTEELKYDSVSSDFISGCAMLIRAEVFAKIGLLDEDFFLYWEDVDFSVRAKRAGYSLVVVANSHICHLEKSEINRPKKVYWLVLSGLLFFKKNTPAHLSLRVFIYTILRRMKNWNDVRRNRTEMNLSVQRAYWDFKNVKCEK
jgi:GT2 family glycosyltransferase